MYVLFHKWIPIHDLHNLVIEATFSIYQNTMQESTSSQLQIM